jgi:cysteine desulfurase/selenocysteine lyase
MTDSAIYLDNAATSFPKPECVYAAVDRYQRENGRPVGRGSTDASIQLQRIVDRCRLRAAELLGATAKEQIVFTFNCTDSLNTVLHGFLREGDHVVSSEAEHNSVLRPLRQLERTQGISLSLVEIDDAGFFRAADVAAAVRPDTKLIILQHASNVTGAIQPIEAIGRLARQNGIVFAVDAAQTAGHLPIDVQELDADFLACAGHKGLLGPLGTGLLYIAPGRESDLTPLRQGGTGSRSELDTQPDTMPDRFESGNHNAPGIVGLDAALGWLSERGVDTVRSHELALTQRLVAGLREIPALRIFGHEDSSRHTGVVSVVSELYSSDELASLLSGHFQIDTRAGLHCAPLMHRRLGTIEQQGAVRFSVGIHNTANEVDAALDALRQVSSL